MTNYTVTVSDPQNLIDQALEDELRDAGIYVAKHIGEYINWKGTMDLEIRIADHSQSPYPEADGILPALGSVNWTGSAWTNSTLSEALTGIDEYPDQPDIGTTIYLSEDGTIRNYGMPVWIDPEPDKNITPAIPRGSFDFIGVLIHEVFHALGLYGSTQEWQRFTTSESGIGFFVGEKVIELYGSPLPLSAINGDHYGNTAYEENRVPSGLMFQWGNYQGNRLDIGRIDLAILEDLGYEIVTYENLALYDLLDSDPSVQDSSFTNQIYGDYQNNTIYLSLTDDPDTTDGGSGIDTVVFPADSSQFSWAKFVVDVLPNSSEESWEGWSFNSETLKNVERVEFVDKKIALDIDGNAGAVAKLLGAFLGAEGVQIAEYVTIGLEALDSGTSFEGLLQLALDTVFGSDPSGTELVSTFYKNLTGQTAPQDVIDTYATLIDSGSLTPLELATQVAEHPLNAESIDLIGLATTGIEYA